ncbi:LytR C-terminal domain-containing protein [Nocardioides pacificus]
MTFLPRRDERGVALPSPLVMLSVIAVAMAGIAFVATQDGDNDETVQIVSKQPSPSESPTPSEAPATTKPKPEKKAPVVKRGEVYVEIFNNSGITGLAGSTATKASGAGWQVVGSDNWVGTIPASTVYFPPRLKDAATMLARDLGVKRLMPAVAPMRFDRLTVILTADYS